MTSPEKFFTTQITLWPKFGDPSISLRELIITSILYGFDQKKNNFSEGCSWFKVKNLRLALGMDSKFYTSVAEYG